MPYFEPKLLVNLLAERRQGEFSLNESDSMLLDIVEQTLVT